MTLISSALASAKAVPAKAAPVPSTTTASPAKAGTAPAKPAAAATTAPATTTAAPAAKTGVLAKVKALPLGAKIIYGGSLGALALVGTPVLLPAAVISAGTAVYYRTKGKRGMTPERKAIYEALLRNMKDSKKLREMADVFEKEGLKDEALHLRLRANLRDMPPKVRADRREAYAKAIAVTDPKKAPEIEALAAEFQKIGADGAAADLRTYAATLKARA